MVLFRDNFVKNLPIFKLKVCAVANFLDRKFVPRSENRCSVAPYLQNISSTSNFAMVSVVWLGTANDLPTQSDTIDVKQHLCFHSLLEAVVGHPLLLCETVHLL